MTSYTTSFGVQSADQASQSVAAGLKASPAAGIAQPTTKLATTAPAGAAATDPIGSSLASKLQPKYPNTQFATQAQTNQVVKAKQAAGDQYHAQHLGFWDSIKSIFGFATSPSSPEDAELGQDRFMRPMIEQEMVQKYTPQIQQVEHLQNRVVNSLPASPIVAGTKPDGPGTTVLQRAPTPGAGENLGTISQLARQETHIKQQASMEAGKLTDDVVLQNLKTVVHSPTIMEKAAAIGNKVIKGASGGAITNAFQEGIDPRVIEAQNYAHPKGEVQSVLEGAGELAGSIPYFMAAEGGAVRIGEAMRSVEGIDNFYKSYPYLAQFVAKNVGMTAVDGAWKKVTGQEYGSKEFLMNLGFQSTFDHVLGGSQARVMAHVDNEAEILSKELGRMPDSIELFDRLADKTVPGQQFTYGHLFAEQRLAFAHGIDPLDGMPRKGIPGRDFPAPLPEAPNPISTKVDVNAVKTDPARFQFRDNVHPQLGYQEENVQNILNHQGFRPNEVRPLEIGRYPDAAGALQEHLVNGHNTLEILKRQGIAQAEARHIDFPNEAAAVDYARRANMVSKAPEILQRVRIAGDLFTSGKSVEQVASEMGRIKPSEAQNLLHIGQLDPSIQRQVSQGALPPDLAGVIGKYSKQLGLDVGMQEQLATKVREDKFTKTRLENYLDALGKAATSTKQENTLFGIQDIPKGFDEIEQKLAEKKTEIATLQRQYKNAANLPEGELSKNQIGKFTKKQEALRQQVKAMDYLLATGGKGEELVKPPKDLSRKVLADMQAELFGAPAENFPKVPVVEGAVNGVPANIDTRPHAAGPLSTEEKKVERAAYEYITKHKAEMFSKFDAPTSENPHVIFTAGGTGAGKTSGLQRVKSSMTTEPFIEAGADNLKAMLFPIAKELNLPVNSAKEFLTKYSEAIHEPASDAAKELFNVRLQEGKNLVYDSNLTGGAATEERIRKSIDTGRETKIIYTHRDPVQSYFEGVLPRQEKTGRTINIEEHAARHVQAPQKFLELQGKFGDQAGFHVIDNSLGKGNAKEVPIDFLRGLNYSEGDVRDAIQQEAKQRGSVREGSGPGSEAGSIHSGGQEAGREGNNGGLHDAEGNQGGGEGGRPVDPPPAGEPIPVEEIPALRPSKYTSEGAKQTLETVLRTHPDLLVSRTRGIISDAEALEKAAQVGVSKDALLKLPEGSMLTKEQVIAARQMVAAHGEDVELLKKAAELESRAGEGTEVQQEYVQSLVEHAQLQSRLKGVAAEAGRSVQSWKIPISPLDKKLSEFYDILHTADQKTADAMARDFGNIDKNDMPAVSKLVNKYSDLSWMDMAVELSTSAKLWATKTLSVIANSHFLNNIAVASFRVPVAGIDAVRSAVTGAPRERFLAEAAADFAGQGKGAVEAFKMPGIFSTPSRAESAGYLASLRQNAGSFWQALLDEHYVPPNEAQDAITLPAIRGRANSDAFIDTALDQGGKVIRLPFRLHNSIYTAFRTMSNSGELGALAIRKAMQEGLTGEPALARMREILAAPPSDLMELAGDAAKERSFQADLGKLGTSINKIRNDYPILKIFFDPFFKIPANIIKKGFSGIDPFLLKAGLQAGGGKSSEAIARFTIGSTTAALLTWYALDHTITGEAPQDQKLRDELYAKGWQANSIRIGDKYYSWDRIEPFSQYFRVAASLAQAYQTTGKINEAMAKNFGVELLKQTVNRSFIAGISSTLNAVIDPARYGQKWVENFAWGNIPGSGLVGGITNAIDTDANGNTIIRNPKTFTEFLKSKIPGLSPGIPAKFDSQGRMQTKPGGLVNAMISPVAVSNATASKKEIVQAEDDFREYKNFQQQQSSRQAALSLKARETIVQWMKLPRDAFAANLAQLQKTNPELSAKITTALKQKAKGFTFQDQNLLDLSPPERAQYMVSILRKLKPDDGKQQFADWKKKGLLTTATMTEFKNALRGLSPSDQ